MSSLASLEQIGQPPVFHLQLMQVPLLLQALALCEHRHRSSEKLAG